MKSKSLPGGASFRKVAVPGVCLWAATAVLLVQACAQNGSTPSAHAENQAVVRTEHPEPLELLLEGNKRFREMHPLHPDQTLSRLRQLERGQHPFAVILSCSDSRVPPELIFDQGLGDLFVIRNAGNIVSDYELGSIEYAVEHLGTRLIVILGHEQCGAIGAFIEHKHDQVPNHIQKIIDYIKAEPEELALDEHKPGYYQAAIEGNVRHGVNVIAASEPVLKDILETRQVRVVGMMYDLDSGKVELIQ